MHRREERVLNLLCRKEQFICQDCQRLVHCVQLNVPLVFADLARSSGELGAEIPEDRYVGACHGAKQALGCRQQCPGIGAIVQFEQLWVRMELRNSGCNERPQNLHRFG